MNTKINQLFHESRSRMNEKRMLQDVETLCQIEMGQTFDAYHRATQKILEMLQLSGIPNAELLSWPADGRTVYEDKRMPIAWDATIGKLILQDDAQTVAADFTKHPFNLIKGSVSTKAGGETVRIVTEAQMLTGEDVRGAMVMLAPKTAPRPQALRTILDLGGRGLISDYLVGREGHPDAIQWVNACTEGSNWHVQCDDRDFIGFSVSQTIGEHIRKLASEGTLMATMECDGTRHPGTLPGVTALIPGRRKEEVWLLAHAFEPLMNDDSNGIVAAIEIARQMMQMGTPEYSLRLIFAMELYGYAAFHAGFKGCVIGAANLDSIPSTKGDTCKITPPIASHPFHGVEILPGLIEEIKNEIPCVMTPPECFDDMFLSDASIGIPTLWFRYQHGEGVQGMWHNSAQNEPGAFDAKTFTDFTALAATWCALTLFHPEAAPALSRPAVSQAASQPPDAPWRTLAENLTYARNQAGFPQDLVRIPKAKRHSLPDGMIYGAMASLLSGMDGQKGLGQIIRETELERNITLTDDQIRKYVNACNYLADWGYLTPVRREELTREMLRDALRQLGVKKGDCVLVHSSLSKCGYFKDGASGLIQGVLDAVGAPDSGTALFPTFTRPYMRLGESPNTGWNFRPFDATDPSQIWVGEVPRALLEQFPDAPRSRHITHSWAGIGAQAAFCLDAHRPDDPPASENSPLGKALELGGSVLYIGTGLGPSTFLHYLETVCQLPCLLPAICRVKNPDGSLATVTIPNHLPGHRDFYRQDAENSKFFLKAVERGLLIREIPFGLAKIQRIELRQFYDIGLQIFQEDPNILLCDNPECDFCHKWSTHRQSR